MSDAAGVRVTSEIGPLRVVMCHVPGPELLAVTPGTRDDFLYDDIISLQLARREHERFIAVLSRFAQVLEVRDLLEQIADLPEVRRFFIEKVMDVARSEPLADRLLQLPAPELVGMLIEGREVEPGPLQRLLKVENYELPPLPNLFFTRDAGMVVGESVIIGSMKYTVRWTEELLMKALFAYHPELRNRGLIYDGSQERRAGYTLEGGDVHVLRPDLVLLGMSERSSPSAFDTIAGALVQQAGVRDVLIVVLPTDRAMIHLDMIFTMVDREHCVIYPPSFVGPTRFPVLRYQAGHAGVDELSNLFDGLREVALPLEPVFCGGPRRTMQEREQWSSGCNFVAVRPGVVLGYERNEETCRELEREAGYTVMEGDAFLASPDLPGKDARVVITFPGAELVRGGGGSRCMTMPLLREDVW